MSISGSIIAKCKECKCVFTWTMENMPFVDSEVLGTCDNCIQTKSHICIDETLDFQEVGSKLFTKKERSGGGKD